MPWEMGRGKKYIACIYEYVTDGYIFHASECMRRRKIEIEIGKEWTVEEVLEEEREEKGGVGRKK